MNPEIYFLSSLESIAFEAPRTCVFLQKLRFDTGRECVLVKVDPPVPGEHFRNGLDVHLLVLAPRHHGYGLSPIKAFPCFVFITLPLVKDIQTQDQIVKEDLEIIAWGELYRTKHDADQHRFG